MPDAEAPPPTCSSCGRSLPAGDGRRVTVCHGCGVSQPHPVPLAIGQEVLVPDTADYRLAECQGCTNPDAIDLGALGCRPLEDLIVVVRDREALFPGALVYAPGRSGWYRTWVVRVSDDGVTVKHKDNRFDDATFDRMIPADDLRVPAHHELRETKPIPTTPWMTPQQKRALRRRAVPMALGAVAALLCALATVYYFS
jgi:hypothetical protein